MQNDIFTAWKCKKKCHTAGASAGFDKIFAEVQKILECNRILQ